MHYLDILFQQDNSDDKCYDSLTGSEGYDVSSEDEADDFSSNTSEEGKSCYRGERALYLLIQPLTDPL